MAAQVQSMSIPVFPVALQPSFRYRADEAATRQHNFKVEISIGLRSACGQVKVYRGPTFLSHTNISGVASGAVGEGCTSLRAVYEDDAE